MLRCWNKKDTYNQSLFLSDKENTCEVSKDKSEANATLICKFSEDIARRQLNISVYKHIDLHKKGKIILMRDRKTLP